ncbi:hypothetical protein L6452_14697 [Arctium lappa]|uniref:Uncharacterized protein n=1 Tax=Arctium lappa TaxID=4217 RepID=A0ACB9CM82_ARCLA|nr:hypothetical protein L6452_14697 [Arctium lappa]
MGSLWQMEIYGPTSGSLQVLSSSTKILRDFSTAVFMSNTPKLVTKVSESSIHKQIIALQDLLMKTALDSMFKVGFGFDLDTLSGSDEVSNRFIKAFDESNCIIFWRYVDPLWRLKRYLNIGKEAALKTNIRVIDNFVYELIEHKREQMKNGKLDDGNCSKKDDILPDGFKIKKGDEASYMAYPMGRMPYIWGEDAEEFWPERWLHDGVFRPESPFKFTAFQGGPRICLGKEFAYRQMKIMAAFLVFFFKFELADKGKEATYKTMLTLHMDNGLHLYAFPHVPAYFK